MNNVVVDYPLVNIATSHVVKSTNQAKEMAGSGQVILPEASRIPSLFRPRAKVRALDDISLTVEHGCAVALLGLNGSGKSTLLRVLGGLIVPVSGNIEIEKNRLGIFNMRQGVRMEATGRRNIYIRGQILGFSTIEIEEKFDLIEDFANLGSFMDLPVSSYSTGMTLRLAFAVCVAFKPRLLLLDEWIGTVDASFQDKAQSWLMEFVEDGGSVLLASHSVGLLSKVCSSAVLLNKGKVVMQSNLQDVIRGYRDIRAKNRTQY